MSLGLSDAHQQFIKHLETNGKANATVIAYGKDIEQLMNYAEKQGINDIGLISTDTIDGFKSQLKKNRYTSKSISRKINSIKGLFRFLIGKGEIEENPAEDVSHPKLDQAMPRVLTRLEYGALRDACRGDARISAIVELLLQTGMRISELAGLQVQDIDLDRNVVTITEDNSQSSRKLPLNKAAKTALMQYLQVRPRAREKTLFLTKTCRPFLVRNIRTAVDRYFEQAGIEDAKVNDLRHTFIVEQLKAGTPLVYVSQLVGHKRITTTEKYLKLVEGSSVNPSVEIEQL